MKSSVDEVREKEIAFLQGNFDNVRFSENYCFAERDAESLTDLIDISFFEFDVKIIIFMFSYPS